MLKKKKTVEKKLYIIIYDLPKIRVGQTHTTRN